MGPPISGTIAEIFLQHLENTHIKHQLDMNHILFYARYVDDILVIYNSTLTNPDLIVHYSNTIHNNMRLTTNTESDHSFSFLDLQITRNPPNLEIKIIRKPTTTDTTINFYSNRPLEHKMAAHRYHIERMYKLPITG
jgi:hypothetical protein